MEVLQEYLNSQEKEFIAEIDRTKVGLHFEILLYSLKKTAVFSNLSDRKPKLDIQSDFFKAKVLVVMIISSANLVLI